MSTEDDTDEESTENNSSSSSDPVVTSSSTTTGTSSDADCTFLGPFINVDQDGPEELAAGDSRLNGTLGRQKPNGFPIIEDSPTFRTVPGSHYIGMICTPAAQKYKLLMYYAGMYDGWIQGGIQADITAETQIDVQIHENAHEVVYRHVAQRINAFYDEKVSLLRSLQHASKSAAFAAIASMEQKLRQQCNAWFAAIASFYNEYHDGSVMVNGVLTYVGLKTEDYTRDGAVRKRFRNGVPDWVDAYGLLSQIEQRTPQSQQQTVTNPVTNHNHTIPAVIVPQPE